MGAIGISRNIEIMDRVLRGAFFLFVFFGTILGWYIYIYIYIYLVWFSFFIPMVTPVNSKSHNWLVFIAESVLFILSFILRQP